MGLDSVEIVMGWEEAFGIRIPDAEACDLTTPKKAIDYCSGRLAAGAPADSCLSMKIFYRIRNAIHKVTDAPLREIRPLSKLNALFPKATRSDEWRAFRSATSIRVMTNPWGITTLVTGSRTVEDLVFEALQASVASMKPGRAWTRSEVREVIRGVVRDQIGLRRFSDHDEFVRDLGVD